ncbi:MAG: TniB family protein, partial [Polaromonas sp.]|nr:TniB family protein [Polaromonas sp.]
RWQANDDFRRFLAAFERIIPLRRASDLAQRAIVEFVLAYSRGLTGEVSRLLNESAQAAILDKSEMIQAGSSGTCCQIERLSIGPGRRRPAHFMKRRWVAGWVGLQRAMILPRFHVQQVMLPKGCVPLQLGRGTQWTCACARGCSSPRSSPRCPAGPEPGFRSVPGRSARP